MKTIRKYIFVITLFITTSSYRTSSCFSDNMPDQVVWITVFVHGIMSIQPHLTSENFFRFFSDDIKNTPYERAVYYIRQDRFFYKNQAMHKFGLHEIDINDIRQENAASAIANLYEQVTQLVEPHTKNHYYTFGWSGLLSASERYIEAEHLYRQLIELIKKFITKGIEPKIRLIGYSHGANVCLNFAAIRRDKYPQNSILSINELILLAGPIQCETDYLVNDKIFKRVYNFYSEKDRIQPIDFFSPGKLFSGKRFKNRISFSIDKKVRQVRIEINRLVCTDVCNHERYIAATKNICVPGVITGRHSFLRNMSPGHIELWFFNWSPKHYRQDFILAPVPILIYLPYIIHHLENNIKHFTTPSPIIADIRPDHEQMLFRQGCYNQYVRTVPFFSNAKRKEFANIANITRPDSYTSQEYDKHLYNAIDKAYRDFYCPGKPAMTKREKKNHRRMRKRTVAPPETPCIIYK